MVKQQVNIRVSDATRAKLDALTERYGTQAEAVAVAIDRLYNAELAATHPAAPPPAAGERREQEQGE